MPRIEAARTSSARTLMQSVGPKGRAEGASHAGTKLIQADLSVLVDVI